MAALHFSTAISSIAFGLFFVLAWIQNGTRFGVEGAGKGTDLRFSRVGWILILWFAILVARAFFSGLDLFLASQEVSKSWIEAMKEGGLIRELQSKSPLLLLGIGFLFSWRFDWEIGKNWMFLLLPFFWIITASCIHYFQHFAFYSQMVLESKPIPMYTQVYHIEFGAMAGIVLLIPVYANLIMKERSWRWGSWVWIVWGITVIGFHVLALRTGLILFYLGMAMIVFRFVFLSGNLDVRAKKRWIQGTGILVGLILLTISVIPSTRNRIVNTWQDLSGVVEGGDANHRSVGQRVWAWKAAIGLIEENPWGAGIQGEFDAMMMQYDNQKIPLQIQHRIGIHNQWLESAAQSGWIVLLVMIVFYWSIYKGGFSLLWISLMGFSMVIESMLERQAGMLLFAFLLVFTVSLPLKNKYKEEDFQFNEGIS